MTHIHHKSWNDFVYSFKKNISSVPYNDLKSILKSRAETTKFYKNDLFKKIAIDLDLEILDKEYLRIDITLSKRGQRGKFLVPHIVIESENDAKGDLPNEIHKLLSLNAPVKILLTRFDSLEAQLVSDFENHEDTHWYYPLKDFIEFDRLDGIFAVISLEINASGEYQIAYVSYDCNGKLEDIQSFHLGQKNDIFSEGLQT